MAKPLKPVGKQRIMPVEQKETKDSEKRREEEEKRIEPDFYGIQDIPQSPMLKAFMDQTNLDYNDESLHYNGSKEKEEEMLEKASSEANNEIMNYMTQRGSKTSSVRNAVEYPHQVKEGDLDGITEPHERLKGYDHSLDQNRDWESLPKPDPEPEGLRLFPRSQE